MHSCEASAQKDSQNPHIRIGGDRLLSGSRRGLSGGLLDFRLYSSHVRIHHSPALLVRIVAITDRPGRNRWAAAWPRSSTIFTGTRCTTFVKLPVALSGGNNANCEPLAGDT